ncbi:MULTISPECIES: LysR substrate-binding domain-containing protein [Bradyrhizobium]|jgi:LysR family transcriptional regulator, glycine cleavage system transcriptional activator|uniref:LysR family glycine cleavage system transcriptional activator n=1 Tax=Bradyrhizobium elkanii TaxID=29448 RepID=A0ABV4EQF2_BRAEL|nr:MULTISPECIES: LysR substrate-binding domain-containing protein [Bradyrhizobium]MCP1758749.1 DNA-binding transcriptional LysR family regulator [Bradyrhizobium elkanii]MCP1975768.1 DNA-binding transcriptional LysR family regulator [Bradyrhizobium elkanii]MCP1984946.1 DNA-binding transcriptional LysR family regulator [Bradyrhizobium elkanii]MCS3695295.1 DNA-binding transcriptional LysR family regulator [Bradyrhizobium elkanii]MCS3890700.1 DNA-binding transcriptional LysR family regulator [Brad
MARPKPSLNALRAFEATARLRSMTAASLELSVTHGAISRHIRSLEELLGVPLLVRTSSSTDPTPEGSRLAEGLTAAFNLIDGSVEQILPGPLTVSCSATIMMYWLIPRLAGFHEAHRNIDLQFNMNYDQVDFIRDKVSVAIRSSTITPPKDVVIKELAREWISPVCATSYAKANRLRRPSDIADCRLLGTRTRPEAWSDWLDELGLRQDVRIQESYEHFYLLIQAALCGLGLALVPTMFVLEEINSGRLVAPFGSIPGKRMLMLWTAPHVASRPESRAVSNWLTREMSATAEMCAGLGSVDA